MPHTHCTGRADRKLSDIAVVPGRGTGRHAESGMHKRIGLFANAHQELANNMRLPGKLRRVSNVLPLAAAIYEQGIADFNPLGRRAENFQEISARIHTAFFDDLYAHSLAQNTARYKEYAPFISPYGVASIGEICEFNINAHVHLRLDLMFLFFIEASL